MYEQFAETAQEERTFAICMRLLRQYNNVGPKGKNGIVTSIIDLKVPHELRNNVKAQCTLEGLI